MTKKKSKSKWVNNVGKIFKTRKGTNILSLPIAEEVEIVLQRKTKEGEKLERVLLKPTVNEKGYSSVVFTLSKPDEEYKINDNHLFDLSLPPSREE